MSDSQKESFEKQDGFKYQSGYVHSLIDLPWTKVTLVTASIEMLLHLIWHHISYYISNNVLASNPGRQRPFSTSSAFAHSQSPAMGPNLAQSHLKSSTLRYLAIPNVSSFRTDASLMVSRVVKKLEDIELVRESFLMILFARLTKRNLERTHRRERLEGQPNLP